MRLTRIALVFGLILSGLISAHAQIDDLQLIPGVNVPISPQGDVQVDDDEVPTREELRALGLSEEEIDLIYENLESQGVETPESSVLGSPVQPGTGETPSAMPGLIDGESTTTEIEGVDVSNETITDQTIAKALATESMEFSAFLFGQDYFRNPAKRDFYATKRAPDNYVLGPGDELVISIFGKADYNDVFKINNDGFIYQQKAGRIYLKGVELGDARVLLKNRFARYFNLRDSKFDVNVKYTPAIRVNVVGEVAKPGTYTISTFNSAFNALSLVDGTTDIGSVRKVQIRRNGETIKILDLYQFLMDPNSNADYFLQDNDYLVVPGYEKAVAITGAVKRPHRYELLDHENLLTLIEYAQGLDAAAYTQNIQVKRFAGNRLNIIDVNLDSIMTFGGDFPLQDGDEIAISMIPTTLEDYVEVKGAVNFPGQYELRPGYRVSDVLDKSRGVSATAKMDRAYLIRLDEDYNATYIPLDIGAIMTNPGVEDNLLLERFDVIEVFDKVSFIDTSRQVTIEGAVINPGNFTFAKGMTLKDLLYYSGGLKTEAANNRIEIARNVTYDPATDQYVPGQTEIKQVEIGLDLAIDQASEEFLLQPYDLISVRVAEDFTFHQTITITGEVKFPGTYTLSSKDESIIDVIDRAGGFTSAAFLEGATLARSDKEIGNIILDLEKAIDDPESAFNHVLQEGDVINIPKTMDYVVMSGIVKHPEIEERGIISMPYEKGKRAKYYVNNYGGGFDDKARRRDTYVLEPGGKVKRTKEILFINFYPKVDVEGSQVVVVPKPKPNRATLPQTKKPFDWNLFASSVSAAALSFATIYTLVERTR